jgi:hypothetical protein
MSTDAKRLRALSTWSFNGRPDSSKRIASFPPSAPSRSASADYPPSRGERTDFPVGTAPAAPKSALHRFEYLVGGNIRPEESSIPLREPA